MRRFDTVEPGVPVHRGDAAVSGEEVLEAGRRRRVPRWYWALATAAAALLVVGVALGRSASHNHGTPPSSSGSSPVLNVPLPVGAMHDPALQVGSGAVLDAVAFGQHSWLLHADRITGLSIAAGRNKSVPLPRLGPSAANGSLRLVLDPTTARLWVVLEGVRPGRAVEYNLWTLTRVREVRLPWINGAAAMNGHLYVTSDQQLIDVPPQAAAHAMRVPGVSGALGPITADPARSRVLMLDYSARTHIWSYRPRQNKIRVAAVLPFTKASIAVTDQAVWVGGFTRTSAVLWQLAAGSLTRRGASPLSGELGPGAVLLAGGTHDVWVGSGGGPGLWCVDGQTGTDEQHWTVTATAVSTDHQRVIAVTNGKAVPLDLNARCTG